MKTQAPYLFLRDDLFALREKRKDLLSKYEKAAKDSGEACTQSSETYHDNFPYEQAMRDMDLYSKMISDMDAVLTRAKEVDYPGQNPSYVTLGCKVRVLDLESNSYRWLKIGSYLCDTEAELNGENEDKATPVSYASPIAVPLMRKKVGDKALFTPPHKKERLLVISEIVAVTPS